MPSVQSAAVPPISEAPDSSLRRRSPVDEVPAAERDNPFVQYMQSLTPEKREGMARLAEAAQLYDGDVERALDDIKAGRHPLQREGRNLDAWERHEAELAAIRAKLER